MIRTICFLCSVILEITNGYVVSVRVNLCAIINESVSESMRKGL